MNHEIIQSLTNNFESHANQTEEIIKFWLARVVQYLLGCTK